MTYKALLTFVMGLSHTFCGTPTSLRLMTKRHLSYKSGFTLATWHSKILKVQILQLCFCDPHFKWASCCYLYTRTKIMKWPRLPLQSPLCNEHTHTQHHSHVYKPKPQEVSTPSASLLSPRCPSFLPVVELVLQSHAVSQPNYFMSSPDVQILFPKSIHGFYNSVLATFLRQREKN